MVANTLTSTTSTSGKRQVGQVTKPKIDVPKNQLLETIPASYLSDKSVGAYAFWSVCQYAKQFNPFPLLWALLEETKGKYYISYQLFNKSREKSHLLNNYL